MRHDKTAFDYGDDTLADVQARSREAAHGIYIGVNGPGGDAWMSGAPEQALLDTSPPLTAPGLVQRDPVDVTARRAHTPDARPAHQRAHARLVDRVARHVRIADREHQRSDETRVFTHIPDLEFLSGVRHRHIKPHQARNAGPPRGKSS